jgi:hypothetical protein
MRLSRHASTSIGNKCGITEQIEGELLQGFIPTLIGARWHEDGD